MKVPNNITKCVAFLAYYDFENNTHVPVGTAFYLGRDNGEKADPVYMVTARHVIDGLKGKGVENVYAILNLKDGQPTARGRAELPIKDWFSHPTDNSIDIAIYKTGISDGADHMVFPMSLAVSDSIMADHEVGLGDNVFVTGLFRHHFGTRRNIPIIRTGNLAAFDEEKISTKDRGLMDAYLIEARSIGGLSGSPVILNLGHVRAIKGEIKHWKSSDPAFYLLGAIHGHYDVDAGSVDMDEIISDGGLSNERINTGIAIVVPYYNIEKVIEAFEAI